MVLAGVCSATRQPPSPSPSPTKSLFVLPPLATHLRRRRAAFLPLPRSFRGGLVRHTPLFLKTKFHVASIHTERPFNFYF